MVPKIHFHIRWHPSEDWDWEAFLTRQEAESRAEALKQSGERCTVEQFDERCPRCRTLALMSRLT
jgi:hypothetical protein